MIRFINCMRRRHDKTSEQFRKYWNDPKFDAITGRSKNLTLIVSAN